MKDYGESVAFLGQWGCFQFVIFFLLCVSIIPNGFGAFTMVFLTDVPPHHCTVPGANLTEEWQKAAIPLVVVDGVEQQSSCSRYRLDVVMDLWAQGFAPGDVNLTELQQEPCVDGWSYSKDIYQSTLVTEFDLVCGDQWKQPLTSTLYFTGVLVGSFISGMLSDRFGRKPVFFITLGIQALFTFLQMFSSSWEMYAALMFFCGMGQIANYVAFVLGMEVFSGNVQTVFTTVGLGLSFSFGYMLLSLVAYLIRQWRFLVLAVSLPGAVLIPFWWITPESPRWLLSQGRVEEAEAIVKKAAAMNKVNAPPVIFEKYMAEENRANKSHKQLPVIELYINQEMRVPSLILGLLWFAVSIDYYGLSLNTSKISTDPFLACFISAVVEVPAFGVSWFALKFWPRRFSIILFMLLGGVALLTIQAAPPTLPALSFALEMFGKFCFSVTTNMAYPCTGEIYPTFIRNTATGVFSTISRVGASITPFIFQLSVHFKFLPYIVLGSVSVASTIAVLFLPETFGHPLPETTGDMHKFKRLSCSCVSQKNLSNPVDVSETKL